METENKSLNTKNGDLAAENESLSKENKSLWSFQTEDTKLKRFLPMNQHTQRKLLNFEFWTNGELSKVPKFDFQSQFSTSKIIQIFLFLCH